MCPSTLSEIHDRIRKKFYWNAAKCIGCRLCEFDCPSNALQLITIDETTQKYQMRYNAARCLFCAQCVVTCEEGSIAITSVEFDFSSNNKDDYEIVFG